MSEPLTDEQRDALGRVAFASYFDADPARTWAALDPRIRDLWIGIASRVVDAYEALSQPHTD